MRLGCYSQLRDEAIRSPMNLLSPGRPGPETTAACFLKAAGKRALWDKEPSTIEDSFTARAWAAWTR